MTKASDSINVYQVSTFLGAMVDELYGNETIATVTTVLTLFDALGGLFFKRRVQSFWTSETLSVLDGKFEEHISKTENLF